MIVDKSCVPIWISERHHKSLLHRKTNFEVHTDEEINVFYKFKSVNQMRKLMECFQLDEEVIIEGHHYTGEEILMIGLCRLHFPTRLIEMESHFGRDYTSLGRAFHWFINFFIKNWTYLISNNMSFWVKDLPYYCEMVRSTVEQNLQFKSNFLLRRSKRWF